jgi:predicted  nucleic acid-binding Zn-ribbon protein
MAEHRTRVGLHARNDTLFTEADYALIRRARIETLKMMSSTDIRVYERLHKENPDLEFIVRLYDDRIRRDSRPSPADFVAKMVPIIDSKRPYAIKYEIHNEPNHQEGIEGWGAADENARAFLVWYMQVLPALKQACPWATFGFPGLAPFHRDLSWLDICAEAISASDWLGCHCYWQYNNMLNEQWGLRFKLYHQRFPEEGIEITEFGNSTPPEQVSREQIAAQYAQYYEELNKYPYLSSASAFIASSPDPQWVQFVWMKEGGEMLPVTQSVAVMERKPVDVEPAPAPEPTPEPEPAPGPSPVPERKFTQTGKTVRGSFLKFFDNYGLDICGYPITEQLEEFGLQAQYFQRVGLEELKSGAIRLKLVGTEAWTSRTKITDLETQIKELSQKPPVAGPTKPPINDIVDALPTDKDNPYPTRASTEIKQIVIHHTATTPTITPQRLAEYQVEKLGKAGIIYHFVVAADGTIYQTNKIETVSDHAYARNQASIGICFPGNFTDAIPPEAQLIAGGQLCAWLLGSLRLPTSAIVGLSEFVSTQSPGKQWLSGQRWKEKLLLEVKTVLEASEEEQSALIASLQEKIRTQQEQIKAQQEQITAQQAEATKQQEQIRAQQEQIQVQQAEAAKQQEKIKAQQAEAAKQQEKINAQQEQIRTQQAEAAKQQEEIRVQQEQIQAQQEEIQKLKEQPPVPVPVPTPQPEEGKVGKPLIQDLIDTLPKHATKTYSTRAIGDITTLVIHHSATVPTITPQRIAQYHVKNLDWPGIGYHFVVSADGIIYQSNAVQTVSYHATKANPFGVGICFLGNFTEDVPPSPQLQAGAHLVAWLMQELNVALDNVEGHLKFTATSCPGNQWLKGKKWKQLLRDEIARVQQEASQPSPTPAPSPAAKPIYHYLLFWAHDSTWAEQDWLNAQNYIGTFQPSAGFKSHEAAQAEYVTIVGGPLGVSKEVEEWLKANGCKVDRIAGKNESETKQILDELVRRDKRFLHFDE